MSRASLPIIPSTEKKRKKMFLLVVAVLTVLVFFDIFPPGLERCHWLLLARIHVSVTKLDINDGVKFTIP